MNQIPIITKLNQSFTSTSKMGISMDFLFHRGSKKSLDGKNMENPSIFDDVEATLW